MLGGLQRTVTCTFSAFLLLVVLIGAMLVTVEDEVVDERVVQAEEVDDVLCRTNGCCV